MPSPTEAHAYADLVKHMPMLAVEQETLQLTSDWRVTGLDLVVLDFSMAFAVITMQLCDHPGILDHLNALQTKIRDMLKATQLPYSAPPPKN